MSLPGKKYLVNGVNYHIHDEGDSNNVVLLLHGMPDTSSLWRHQANALVSAGYRVVVPDMLGYGLTDKPKDVARYEGEHLIADMLAIIDVLGLKNINIVGHDWGSFVSWELVFRKPELFNRHVTLSQGHPGAMFGSMSTESAKENWYMYLSTQVHAGQLYAYNNFKFLREAWMPSHPDVDEVCARMADPEAMESMLNWDKANQMASFYLAQVSGELNYPNCTVPTMVLWGTRDAYLKEEWATGTEELMDAEFRYERIEDASHWISLDKPEEVSAFILEWFK